MNFEEELKIQCAAALVELYSCELSASDINTNFTIKDFEGDITVLTFPFVKMTRQSPEVMGNALGEYLVAHADFVEKFNVVKGFLNVTIAPAYWLKFFHGELTNPDFGKGGKKEGLTLLEYCGPNTNKPLHLGHVRNMFIGFAVANILKEAGYEVKKLNINNDRGIAICKSMMAWKKWGAGKTPASEGIKGDHFVGDYYVKFEQENHAQAQALIAGGYDKEKAKQATALMQETQEMLLAWEAGDAETLQIWNTMNGWVYEGFRQTWDRLGIDFDKEYYESQEYIRGKEFVIDGLNKGIFYKKENGAICTDLTSFGMDEKVLLRGDGTSIYLTQDLGLVNQRYVDYRMNKMIYVVMDEQNYHFKVLQCVLKQMGVPYADSVYHLSYGEVALPEGRMKSREGKVVDADDLIDEVVHEATLKTTELGKVTDMPETAVKELNEKIGLAALKYFILKVNPKKKMLFNPAESVDLQGDTGPFIQYSYARIQAILRKMPYQNTNALSDYSMNEIEKNIVFHLYKYPSIVVESAETYDPSVLTQYLFQLSKYFNRFYAELKIIAADREEEKLFRIALAYHTGNILKRGLNLLGIDAVERM